MSGIFGSGASYQPLMLSHQTGLSITASTANTMYAIGSSISIPRNGILVMSMAGHVNVGNGLVQLQLTRGSNTFYYNSTSTISLFSSFQYNNIDNTSSSALYCITATYNTAYAYAASPHFILPVYSGDSLQLYAGNETAGDITYIDDVLVMLI